MEALVVNGLIGIVSLLFGAMALFPMLVERSTARKTPAMFEDDQVISVQPVAASPVSMRPAGQIGVGSEHAPEHRHAA